MAAQMQDQMNEQALANQRAADKPQTHPDFDGLHCIDCEEDLPAVRLAYKRVRCTVCQEAQDKRDKLRGK